LIWSSTEPDELSRTTRISMYERVPAGTETVEFRIVVFPRRTCTVPSIRNTLSIAVVPSRKYRISSVAPPELVDGRIAKPTRMLFGVSRDTALTSCALVRPPSENQRRLSGPVINDPLTSSHLLAS